MLSKVLLRKRRSYCTVYTCFPCHCPLSLRNDLYCVGWGVELYSLTLSLSCTRRSAASFLVVELPFSPETHVIPASRSVASPAAAAARPQVDNWTAQSVRVSHSTPGSRFPHQRRPFFRFRRRKEPTGADDVARMKTAWCLSAALGAFWCAVRRKLCSSNEFFAVIKSNFGIQ